MESSFLLVRPPGCVLDQIREWSHYLRRVANKLNSSLEDSENRLANYFYDVHYAIGPEHMTNIFSLDEDSLRILAKEEGKTPEKVMRGLIESIRIIIREGDNLKPEFMDQSVWNSGLKSYLCNLRDHLEKDHLESGLAKFTFTAESSEFSGPKMIRWLFGFAAAILFISAGFFTSDKYEPRILLVPGCLLVAILLTFFSLRKEKK